MICQYTDETEIKSSLLKTFCNKRVLVHLDTWSEKNSLESHNVKTDRQLCLHVSRSSTEASFIMETKSSRVITSKVFTKQKYLNVDLAIQSEFQRQLFLKLNKTSRSHKRTGDQIE